MTEYLKIIQKNYFSFSLGGTVILGLSLAYFVTNIMVLFFMKPVTAGQTAVQAPMPIVTSSRPPLSEDQLHEIVVGPFIRDSGAAFNTEAAADAGVAQGEFVLVGLIAGSPSFATASIQIVGENEANEYRTGEEFVGYKLISINWDSIVVERGAQRKKVAIGEKSNEVNLTEQPVAAGVPATPGAQRINISRDKLLSLTRNQAELYKNKFRPVQQDGKILGLKMIYVPNNNFLYELGARTGDIIRRINGQELDNMERMMEFYKDIKTASRVTVDMERAGKIVTYEIVIQ